MSDLISREAVLNLAKDIVVPVDGGEYRHRSIDPIEVMELPSAERKNGRWIKENDAFSHCSICGYIAVGVLSDRHYNFCPNCGAEVRGDR